jgi:capsular polysaccharide biosynthesis protein
VKDPDLTTSVSDADDLRDRLWAYEDFSAAQEHPAIDVTSAFASLGFLRAALRRTRRFWLSMGALGFLVGCGLYISSPPPYSASTTILLTNAPGTDPTTAMLTEQSLAASLPVATAVVKQLGLTESPSTVLAGYTATPVSDQVLQITVSAPSGPQALKWAQAIGTQFLKFRANLLTTQEQQEEDSLSTQVAQSQKNLDALGAQITSLGGTVPSITATTPPAEPTAQVTKLETQYLASANRLNSVEQQVEGTNAENQVNVTSQIRGSQVLNTPTLGKHSKLKYIGFDIVAGLFGGLVLGMAIIVVRALISDRLRRRDDISVALGVPVMLSVGEIKRARFSLSRRTRAARESNLRRVATYLRIAIPRKQQGEPRTLAVLPVDNAKTMAPVVSRMTESCAKDGLRIVVADLVKGAPLARVLGYGGGAGIKPVQVGGAQLLVVVPDPDDIAPAGPLHPTTNAAPLALPPGDDLLTAFRSADLLVTFVELDPALGSEHLATWAATGVVLTTAGLTHGQKAYSIGELLRMSGVQVGSAVLVNADEGDDSLGVDVSLQEFVAGSA